MKETVCCFFGHHDVPHEIMDALRRAVRSLIVEENVKRFYVGDHGAFDSMALRILREMREEFEDISYSVVLAYLPEGPTDEFWSYKPHECIFPEELEKVPYQYRIPRRNDWILARSDIMVCYVYHFFGGAGRMLEKAQKKKKRIHNLTKPYGRL